VLEFLDEAKASGKIVNAGFSFHGDRKTFREIIDAYDWTFCQIQYNFLDETTQAGTEGLRYAASNGIAVMVMEPLRGGMLAGKLPDAVKGIYAAAPVQRSAAEWALRWVWNHPEVTVVLSGMNDESHIAENLRVAETALPGAMSPDDLDIIARVAASYKQLMKVGCTGCAYCMPCPAGVNIPQCFSFYNDHAMRVNRLSARVMYGLSLMGAQGTPRADASLCRDCGKCARACPQQIAIPAELKNVDRSLGGLTTRRMGGAFGLVMSRMKVKEDGTE
jgi:predicted aldo/keto reductase-like oxidoreductase